MSHSNSTSTSNPTLSSSNPLPSGWTEHLGPQNQAYFYNSISKESTYTRPTETSPSSNSTIKDKPISKIPIPGADGWLKVTTTQGNVFYSHKPSKRSEWSIPQEIREQVEALDKKSEPKTESVESESDSKRKRVELEGLESITKSVENQNQDDSPSSSKRPRTDDQPEAITEFVSSNGSGNGDQVEEVEGEGEEQESENEDEEWQRQMAAEMAAEAEQEAKEQEEHYKELPNQDRSERANLESKGNVPPGPPPSKPLQPPSFQPQYSGPPPSINYSIPPPNLVQYSGPPSPATIYQAPPPAPVPTNFSHEESMALFKHMLTSLNGTRDEINPMAPWDKELPKFVHRNEYSRLESLKDRQEGFNDWCKNRLREKREEKVRAKNEAGKEKERDQKGKGDSKGKEKSKESGNGSGSSGEEAFKALLKKEVVSTRMTWEEFKKKFRKERDFFGFGRDDKVREKRFRDWLRELGEIKRMASLLSEKAFLSLLSEVIPASLLENPPTSKEEVSSLWKDVKKEQGTKLAEDERYEGVKSSSRRGELFADWLAGKEGESKSDKPKMEKQDSIAASSSSKIESKEELKAKALKERESKVSKSKSELDHQNQKALSSIQQKDFVLNFQNFLIDEVKDATLNWEIISQTFRDDERFNPKFSTIVNSKRDGSLSFNQKKDLVENHLNKLYLKKRDQLNDLFEEITEGKLDLGDDEKKDEFLEAVKLKDDFNRLKLNQVFRDERLRREFERWESVREQAAIEDFEGMLNENAFISFWGKLRKEKKSEGKEGEGEGIQLSEDEDDQPDLLKMAQKVDLEEVHSVLRNDQRYRVFSHLPQKRDQWIREHLQKQAKLNQTVHQT